MTNKEILSISTDIGYLLLKHGAEVFRTEQTIQYICNSYGITDVDVFAIPTSIVVTISIDNDFITKTKRVSGTEVDLDKVAKLNDLSREISKTAPSYSYIKSKIIEIEKTKPYPVYINILSTAIMNFSFALIFGAIFVEGVVAFFIGLIAGCALIFFEKHKYNHFLKITLTSFLISLLVFGSTHIADGAIEYNSIMAGCLMTLVPGVSITNSMRDFMANDYMSGLGRLSEALMTALATALGVAIVILSTAFI